MSVSVCVLCSDTVVIETPDTYNFTYIDDYGVYAAHGDNLLFKVRAKADAHVALARSRFRSFCDLRAIYFEPC